MLVREVDCVKTLADEILRGPILSISEPITHYGISIVPIIAMKSQSALDAYSKTVRGTVPNKMILRPAIYFGFATSKGGNGHATEEARMKIAKQFIRMLPGTTCGVLCLDSNGTVVALNLHLRIRAFWERIDLVEDLIQKYCDPKGMPVDKKMTLVNTTLFLAQLRGINPSEVMQTKNWGNIMIGLPTLTEETDTRQDFRPLTKSVLYCSIGM